MGLLRWLLWPRRQKKHEDEEEPEERPHRKRHAADQGVYRIEFAREGAGIAGVAELPQYPRFRRRGAGHEPAHGAIGEPEIASDRASGLPTADPIRSGAEQDR